jgi:hypothetical protein
MLITMVVLVIVVGFGIMGIVEARASMRVQSSARAFAGYVEKARSDAIRRHATSGVAITSANATSYVVTMDFNLDGVAESRTITLEEGVYFNSDAATLTFDWRGRLSGDGLSFTFEGPGGTYPVQLDVTGSGDVTIGEEKFADSEVPTVTLNNGTAGGDVLDDVTTVTSPTTPPTTTPPTTTPPVTTPPPTTQPPTTPPPTTQPPTTQPPTTPPPTTPPPTTPPPTTPPPTTPPPTTPPPSTPPPSTTPPAGTSCSMTVDLSSVTINACNNGGNQCGSTNVKLSMVGAATGATISATTVPSHLTVSLVSQVSGVYTFKILSKNNTRTTINVTFTGTSCGTKNVSVKTQ